MINLFLHNFFSVFFSNYSERYQSPIKKYLNSAHRDLQNGSIFFWFKKVNLLIVSKKSKLDKILKFFLIMIYLIGI